MAKRKETFKKLPLSQVDEDAIQDVLANIPEEQIVASRRRKKVEEDLSDIYEDENGHIPDMQHVEARRNSSLRRAVSLFMTSLILFAVAGVFALWYSDRSARTGEDVVVFTISTPEVVSPGETTTVRIKYTNTDRLPIAQTQMQIRLPDGFSLTSASPSPYSAESMSWKFGTLISGETGIVELVGVWKADVGEEQSFRGFFTYKPANFSSEFESVATARVKVSQNIVHAVIHAPQTVVAAAPTQYAVQVEKTSSTFGLPIQVQIVRGNGFAINAVSRSPDGGNPGIFVYHISPTGTQSFELFVTGTLAYASSTTAVPFVVEVFAVDGSNIYMLATTSVSVTVEKPDLRVETFVNGGQDDISVKPGDILLLSAVLTNEGDTTFTNTRVVVQIDAPSVEKKSILNWLDITDDANGIVVGNQINTSTRRGAVTWTKKEIPALASIKPGETKRIDIALPIKDGEAITLSDLQSFTIVAQVFAASGDASFSSQIAHVTVNSDMTLATDHKITTEDGVPTYAVTWLLSNTFHPLKDIVVEAELFGDVVWNESDATVPAGTISFDPKTKKVTWNVVEMPQSVDVLALRFSAGLKSQNPTQQQLTSKPIVTAVDTVTNKTIRFVGDEVLLGVTP